jgi:hypothetical protein
MVAVLEVRFFDRRKLREYILDIVVRRMVLNYLVVSTEIPASLLPPKRQNRIAAKRVGRHTADALLDAIRR